MARSGANLAEWMQLCRTRRPKQTVPRFRPKTNNAGKSAFQVAEFNRAYECSKVPAERANGRSILGARIQRCDHKDRGASKRCSHRLRESRRFIFRFGLTHRIGMGIGAHRVSCMVVYADFVL